MNLFLYHYLTELGIKLPIAFTYYSTRMILATITALMLSIFLGKRFIFTLYQFNIGQTVRSEEYGLIGKLHASKKNTPTMGGILILTTMLMSMFLWMDWSHPFTLLLFLTTTILGFAGGYDDYVKIRYRNVKGLSAKRKLAVQLFVALLVTLYLFVPIVSSWAHTWLSAPVIKQGYREISLEQYASLLYVPFFKGYIWAFSGVSTVVIALLSLLVIVGSSNAVNLTDGLDGLAAGSLVLVASALALVAFLSNHFELARYLNITYVEGSGEIAIYLCSLSGACLGFLWYNGHPAQVFMGDVGSLALGGVVGVATVLLKRELLLVIIGGIFVAEALSVILQVASYRYRNKKRIFLCAPLHHHFEYLGWPETKVVLRFWIVGLLLALVGIASLKFQ